MRILVSNAVWGESYCSTFVRFSLASLLASGNIPALTRKAAVTFHIATTWVDRERLLREPGLALLGRYCAIEWLLLEEYGIDKAPTGPGGEKYPFLSALQNLAITRALDHDAVVFNYADFIWSDGGLTHATELLFSSAEPRDAVLGFCVPVDRYGGQAELESYRDPSIPSVVNLSPRDGARIAVSQMHREAKIRFWDGPAFTNLPSYLMWPVDGQGVVIRAYHQSILSLRVRPDDPDYRRGILRGSLDSCLTAELAKRKNLAFATDSDRVLVFSLYDTPVDSRIPAGQTREMSLKNLLESEVTPDQRSFAEQPIFLRMGSGPKKNWTRAVDASWELLSRAHAEIAFKQEAYDRNYETHGIIPRIRRRRSVYRRLPVRFVLNCWKGVIQILARNRRESRFAALARTIAQLRRFTRLSGALASFRQRLTMSIRAEWANVLGRHPYFAAFFERSATSNCGIGSYLLTTFSKMKRATPENSIAVRLVRAFRLLAGAIIRLKRGPPATFLRNESLATEELFVIGKHDAIETLFLPRASTTRLAPQIEISALDNARFIAAIVVEDSASRALDYECLAAALKTAETLLRRAIQSAPPWADAVRALGRNLWFQGRFRESIAAYADAERLRDEMAKIAGWEPDRCIFLPRNCAEVIGLMGHIDSFVKYKILNGDKRRYYLIAPQGHAVNDSFLSYWKDHVIVVSAPEEIASLAPLEPVYAVNWNWIFPRHDKMIFVHPGMAAVQRAWEEAAHPPLLTLRPDHSAALAALRKKWGMVEDDRYVCLHVRSVGFYGVARESAQRFRNTRIDDYYALISAIADMGFWVIRMGDASMPPLDLQACGGSGRVVDYALSADRSPDHDIALCASCALFVSSPSGLHTVAHAFGRPVCEVNFPIYPGFPWHPGDVFVPQLYYSSAKGGILSLEEILGSDVPCRDHQFLLERAGLSLLPNEPDEMIETVKEALAPDSYTVADELLADKVLARFDALNREHDVGISGRLGRYFAVKHAAELLGTPSIQAAAPSHRKLDVIIPTYNRPAKLHHLLRTGLALNVPGMSFVVIDDASTAIDYVPGLGSASPRMVCESFKDARVIYQHNERNLGVAASLARYYREWCDADYTSLFTDKDEFISAGPFIRGLAKLDADPAISLVMIPLRQIDRKSSDRPMLFDYPRMNGRAFLDIYVHDTHLQHAGAYSLVRVEAARRAGIPRPLDLRSDGLEDAGGIDIDNLFLLSTTGDIEFESEAGIRRSVIAGYTERYPLTFAYGYYQYAKRLVGELVPSGGMSPKAARAYLAWWHLLIIRGLIASYRADTAAERGTKRIQGHLKTSILLYLPRECWRLGVIPRWESLVMYYVAAKLHIWHTLSPVFRLSLAE